MNSGERAGYKRLMLALLIAPALLPIYLCITPYFDFYVVRKALAERVATVTVIAYAATVILGLPYTLLLHRKGWLNYGTIMAPTLLLTAAVLILEQTFPYEAWDYGMLGTAPGLLLVGIAFYLLALWRYETHAHWTVLLSIALVWMLHFVCVAIQRHNLETSNPMSDTGSALGLMIIVKGGRILSLGATALLVCVWLVGAFCRLRWPRRA